MRTSVARYIRNGALRRKPGAFRSLLAIVSLGLCASAPCLGQTTIDAPGSLLVFPEVRAAVPVVDTLITITNTGPSNLFARCFYVDAQSCTAAIEFSIQLVGNQPTNWSVGRGRVVDPTDPPCDATEPYCPNAGHDPGAIPAAPNITGPLVCVETDGDGGPVAGNHLVGSASLQTGLQADRSHYQAIHFRFDPDVVTTSELCLGVGDDPACPEVQEIEPCPHNWDVATASDTGLSNAPVRTRTDLVVMPCSLDLVAGNTQPLAVQVKAYDELEQVFSTSLDVACWAKASLADLDLGPDVFGPGFAHYRLSSAVPDRGILAIAHRREEASPDFALFSVDSANLHHSGLIDPSSDKIVLPSVGGKE